MINFQGFQNLIFQTWNITKVAIKRFPFGLVLLLHFAIHTAKQCYTYRDRDAFSSDFHWGLKCSYAFDAADAKCSGAASFSPILFLFFVRISRHRALQPFLLIRQRRHSVFPTALSTRVDNNARKKHAWALLLGDTGFFYDMTKPWLFNAYKHAVKSLSTSVCTILRELYFMFCFLTRCRCYASFSLAKT